MNLYCKYCDKECKIGSSMNWTLDKTKYTVKKYDYLVIITGINDYQQSEEQFDISFKKIITEAQKKANKVYSLAKKTS